MYTTHVKIMIAVMISFGFHAGLWSRCFTTGNSKTGSVTFWIHSGNILTHEMETNLIELNETNIVYFDEL